MTTTLVGAVLLFAVCLTPRALPAGGPLWDTLSGLGLAALALMLPLAWEAEAPARQPRLQLHRNLAIGATLLTTVHAVGYLVADPISLEYLKPKAPAHMLVGILAFFGLIALTLTSLPAPRRRLYATFSRFRQVHLWLSVVVLALTFWHVLGTSFVASGSFRYAMLLIICIVTPALAYLARRRGHVVLLSAAPASTAAANRQAVFAGLFVLLLTALYGAARNP